jgi:methionyl-tRNA formyltransferase
MKRYIIASSKPYYRELPSRLTEQTGAEFIYVESPGQLDTEFLKKVAPRYIFFPHWSYRIPSEIWQLYECVIFHMTDLPYGRGGSPLQNLIVRGHESTVISALRCADGLDSGPIYLKVPLSLAGSAGEIFQRAAQAIEQMILRIVHTEPSPVPQTGEPVVFARRKPEQGISAPWLAWAKFTITSGCWMPRVIRRHFSKPAIYIWIFCHATKTDYYVEATVRIRLKQDE